MSYQQNTINRKSLKSFYAQILYEIQGGVKIELFTSPLPVYYDYRRYWTARRASLLLPFACFNTNTCTLQDNAAAKFYLMNYGYTPMPDHEHSNEDNGTRIGS